jgi:glycosyltransferase involved in cell wall biosynthesis
MTRRLSTQPNIESGDKAKTHIMSHKVSRQEKPLISIIVAFYNEGKTVPEFFDEIERVTTTMQCDVEYVCVNDGSSDGTLELLRRRLASNPHIRIVDLARNFGKEAAITAGLAHAKGDIVVTIDADLQDPPSLIPELIAKWREGYDVVYGVRTCRKVDSALKRWSARGFYALFNHMADVPIPEGAGDFRLMDRRVVDALLQLPERNRFMKGLFSWVGFRQTGVEYIRAARVAGSSAWSYRQLANFAIDGITSFTIAPLRVASLIGLAVSLIGFLFAIYLICKTLILGTDVPGYASVMVAIMFLGGIQLVCLGLIGEYLGRLYIEAKARPLYVISNIFDQSSLVETRSLRHIEEAAK